MPRRTMFTAAQAAQKRKRGLMRRWFGFTAAQAAQKSPLAVAGAPHLFTAAQAAQKNWQNSPAIAQ